MADLRPRTMFALVEPLSISVRPTRLAQNLRILLCRIAQSGRTSTASRFQSSLSSPSALAIDIISATVFSKAATESGYDSNFSFSTHPMNSFEAAPPNESLQRTAPAFAITRSLAILILVLICGISRGNPLIMTHPAYMSSERLEVKLLGDVAEIDGRFHFHSTARPGDPSATANVYFEVPIWVPCDPKNADAATAALLHSCTVSSLNSLTDDNRAAWDSAIGLKITVGKRPLTVDTFAVFDPRSKQDRNRLSAEWFRKGFYCITARVDFQPLWLAADPEIRVQYRQGLRRTSAGSEFHYVPVFWQMPKDQTTRDLSQYAMHFLNASGMTATLGTAAIPAGYSSVLPLAHHEPISIILKSKD